MHACPLDNGLTVPLVGFSHRPRDTRTACVSAIRTSDSLHRDLIHARKTGAPLVFVQINERPQWDVWFQKGETPQKLWSHERGSLDQFFKAHKDEVTAEAIFRAKTLGRLQSQQQLTFVDAGTLEMVETEAGEQLCGLIERMMRTTGERLGLGNLHGLDGKTSQWLVKANFWLLAARLLQDKNVSNFKRLDLSDIDTTFARVTKHYGAEMEQPLSQRRRDALGHAVQELKRHSSLALVSTETLAHVYENALITPQTRKELGTHSTPSWLVDYIFSRLAPWIEAMPPNRRHVYEPTCGHAPFLLGALRLLSSGNPCTKMGDAERHEWLKKRLRGSEIDDFAREVARLSLTLADIPNPNGWLLDEGDLFRGDLLEARIREADIIVANPPFEAKPVGSVINEHKEDLSHVSRAAELLRRITISARPGTLIGLVIPQTLLDSPKVNNLRAILHRDFDWQEILRLPDKDVFKIADVESAVLIGRRRSSADVPTTNTIFKNVVENDVSRFVKAGTASVSKACSVSVIGKAPDYMLLLPDLANLWDYLSEQPTLDDIVHLAKGFDFKPESLGGFPKVVPTKRPGYAQGFYNFDDAPDTHLIPKQVWLNRDENQISTKRLGYDQGIPQIVMNYAPVRRGPWRIAAYIDELGHPATSRFLIVRPRQSRHSLLFLWAILNSPLANAFSKSFTSKRDMLTGTMRKMPLPEASDTQIHEIEIAAHAYRKACLSTAPLRKSRSRAPSSNTAANAPELPGLVDTEIRDGFSDKASDLRELHWRMDAAVLRLYNLTPALERQLLDYFIQHPRERVPFTQSEYIPARIPELQTINELLAITADWALHDKRRSLLIDKECNGSITREERGELKRLQKQTSLRRQLLAPYPIAELDEEIARLKREGKWE